MNTEFHATPAAGPSGDSFPLVGVPACRRHALRPGPRACQDCQAPMCPACHGDPLFRLCPTCVERRGYPSTPVRVAWLGTLLSSTLREGTLALHRSAMPLVAAALVGLQVLLPMLAEEDVGWAPGASTMLAAGFPVASQVLGILMLASLPLGVAFTGGRVTRLGSLLAAAALQAAFLVVVGGPVLVVGALVPPLFLLWFAVSFVWLPLFGVLLCAYAHHGLRPRDMLMLPLRAPRGATARVLFAQWATSVLTGALGASVMVLPEGPVAIVFTTVILCAATLVQSAMSAAGAQFLVDAAAHSGQRFIPR